MNQSSPTATASTTTATSGSTSPPYWTSSPSPRRRFSVAEGDLAGVGLLAGDPRGLVGKAPLDLTGADELDVDLIADLPTGDEGERQIAGRRRQRERDRLRVADAAEAAREHRRSRIDRSGRRLRVDDRHVVVERRLSTGPGLGPGLIAVLGPAGRSVRESWCDLGRREARGRRASGRTYEVTWL